MRGTSLQPGDEYVRAVISGVGALCASGTRAEGPRRGLRRLLPTYDSSRRHQADLIASLNDVAGAVSSTLSVEDVLFTIVDRAKHITNTDKAILILTEDQSEQLDFETVVVRGRMDQHAQAWWEQQVVSSAPAAFANGTAMMESSEKNDAWIVYSPIRMQAQPIGLLCAINSLKHRFTNEQVEFLAILSAFAATAIENARLAEETRYVLLASERDRIAREMHDGISQSLFSISLGMELCKKLLHRGERGAVLERLDELQESLDTSMAELRRFIYDLKPMKLQELGLPGALDYWIREVSVGRTVHGKLEIHGTQHRLTPEQEACLYRVGKEAVSNVVRHANAHQFQVTLDFREDSVVLSVVDDGSGFEPDSVMDHGVPGSGMGLRSIRERVKREHGTFDVSSDAKMGTRIEVTLPVGDES